MCSSASWIHLRATFCDTQVFADNLLAEALEVLNHIDSQSLQLLCFLGPIPFTIVSFRGDSMIDGGVRVVAGIDCDISGVGTTLPGLILYPSSMKTRPKIIKTEGTITSISRET